MNGDIASQCEPIILEAQRLEAECTKKVKEIMMYRYNNPHVIDGDVIDEDIVLQYQRECDGMLYTIQLCKGVVELLDKLCDLKSLDNETQQGVIAQTNEQLEKAKDNSSSVYESFKTRSSILQFAANIMKLKDKESKKDPSRSQRLQQKLHQKQKQRELQTQQQPRREERSGIEQVSNQFYNTQEESKIEIFNPQNPIQPGSLNQVARPNTVIAQPLELKYTIKNENILSKKQKKNRDTSVPLTQYIFQGFTSLPGPRNMYQTKEHTFTLNVESTGWEMRSGRVTNVLNQQRAAGKKGRGQSNLNRSFY